MKFLICILFLMSFGHTLQAFAQTKAQAQTQNWDEDADRLAFKCLYLNGQKSVEFKMSTQAGGDEAVDKFEEDFDVGTTRILTVQAQAINEGKNDLQLSLFLKERSKPNKIIAFAGATSQVVSNRFGAIGMTGAVDDPNTILFQVDCSRQK